MIALKGGGGIDALTKNCPTTNGYQSDVVVVADFFAETGTQGCTDQSVRAADLDPGSAPSLVPGGGGDIDIRLRAVPVASNAYYVFVCATLGYWVKSCHFLCLPAFNLIGTHPTRPHLLRVKI